jgi:phytoene desaturase
LFYACVPSVSDKNVAPEGMENIFLLMPLAPGLEDSEKMRDHYFNLMIERLEQKTNTTIKEHIIVNRSYCLNDFKNDYHSFKGNAYGLANTLKQTAFLKPAMRSNKDINLLYAGQLTVPGPGVPPAIISGRMVASEATSFLSKNI